MDIREIDVSDDAQFHDFYTVLRNSKLHGRPDAPVWSEREARVVFRGPDPTQEARAFAAYEEGHVVGVAEYFLPLLDNTHMAYFEVLVSPQNRRRGIGGAVLRHVVDVASGHGRTVLLGEADLPLTERETHPSVRFAARHGFDRASVEVQSELALPVSDLKLTAWEAAAAPYHRDYRIETFTDKVPDELLESYCYLLNQLAVDAPSGDIQFEPEGLTPAAHRIQRVRSKEQGHTVVETLAIDGSGEAVAQSTLVARADDPHNVWQWGTLVRRDHRGHRLGLAVKARNLRALQSAFPECRKVVTSNSEENDHMLAVNVTMGFEPVELLVEFQRKL